MEKHRDQPEPLDYATPATPASSSATLALAGVCGVVVGFLGIVMLYCGVVGTVWLVRDWQLADGRDVFRVAMFNIIGVMSAYFGARWVRAAWKD